MITVFKKIWNFAEKEQSNIRKSIIVGFLCAAFNAMQMGGVYYVLVKIFDETLKDLNMKPVEGFARLGTIGINCALNINIFMGAARISTPKQRQEINIRQKSS